jgi:hypothetical protein
MGTWSGDRQSSTPSTSVPNGDIGRRPPIMAASSTIVPHVHPQSPWMPQPVTTKCIRHLDPQDLAVGRKRTTRTTTRCWLLRLDISNSMSLAWERSQHTAPPEWHSMVMMRRHPKAQILFVTLSKFLVGQDSGAHHDDTTTTIATEFATPLCSLCSLRPLE